MSIKPYQLKYKSRETILNEQANIIAKKLNDFLAYFESTLDGINKEDIIRLSIELLDLYYEGEKFLEFDGNFKYDEDSVSAIDLGCNEFKKDLNDLKKEDLIEEDVYNKMISILDTLKNIVKNNSIVQNRRPVTFITIPIDSEKSILDYDLVGENCSMKSDSKYPLFFSSPGKFDFVKNMGNKELTEHFLREFDKIESTLGYCDNINATLSKISKDKSDGFKREVGSVYVKKHLTNRTRIVVSQYEDDVVIIYGLFHKESKGTKSDKDDTVQRCYGERETTLGQIKERNLMTIESGSAAYQRFKARLVKMRYGDKIDEIEAMRRYMITRELDKQATL